MILQLFLELELMRYTNTFNEPERFEEERWSFVERNLIDEETARKIIYGIYMGTLIGITSVTSAVKYGISQLLKAGLSDSVIKKVTGASKKLIQGCLFREDHELKQIINIKILMADQYYEF